MRLCSTILLLLLGIGVAMANAPIYIVDGERRDSIDDIPHLQIASFEEEEVSEELIEQWGTDASEGVIKVTLKWEIEPSLHGYNSLSNYLAKSVKWGDSEAVSKISFRYKISPDGEFILCEILESTSQRFRRRVESALKRMPEWSAATKAEKKVEWSGVLNLTLPIGERVPPDRYLISR